jgi:N-acetyl-alpha-D-muramate 1-phosphate uridylyltransferase
MILAAGIGSRLRPITDRMPKPMVLIAGKSLIHRAIEKLVKHGVEKIVINTHYLADMLEKHIKKSPHFNNAEIIIIEESQLYNTGGSVKNALDLLGNDPFFVLNSDVIWLEKGMTSLQRMEANWNPQKMDIEILVHPTKKAIGFTGKGDFYIDGEGRISRLAYGSHMDYIYASTLITTKKYFANSPDGSFCLFRFKYENEFKDGGLMNGAYPVIHHGKWLHVNSPAALVEVEQYLKKYQPALLEENEL